MIFNLYREAFALHFANGTLTRVDSLGFSDQGAIRIPPLLFAPLMLGWKSRAELSDIYPDFSIGGAMHALVDVLFPSMSSFIYSIY
ncbi:MAG: hypothetical protein U0670_14585 [Anaerolineae bacterium]